MKYYLLFITLLIVANNNAFSQVKEYVSHDEYVREWLTYIPKNYDASKSYPLLIALHGGGGNAKQLMNNTRKRFNKLADKKGFIVVYPQGVRKSWNDNPTRDQNGYARKKNIDDVGFINKMITLLESNYSIQSDAIFACGISNGGLMSQTLAMELPDKIKAIGMVASNFGKDQIEKLDQVQPFSILFIHGIDDPVFPYNQGQISVFNRPRGHVLGIKESVSYMCTLNGNNPEPTIDKIKDKSKRDGCISDYFIYANAESPSLKVELIEVKGGGHTWPGAKEQRIISRIVGKTTQDFSACDKLWTFFESLIN